VLIEDVAHALAHQCRFGGHSRTHYSVAQHSVIVSAIVPPEMAMQGLMHDAAEAYVVDVPRPLKRVLDGYAAIEHRVHVAIAKRFGFDPAIPSAVCRADEVALATEARDLMHGSAGWALREHPLAERIDPWSASVACAAFLARFWEIHDLRFDEVGS